MAARSLLLKLEQRGWITLPYRRRKASRRRPIKNKAPAVLEMIQGALSELTPISLKRLTDCKGDDYKIFSEYLVHYHYLGYRGTVGENLAYLIWDRYGRDLGCLLFGAAAWKTEARDRFIGWDSDIRNRRLSYIGFFRV